MDILRLFFQQQESFKKDSACTWNPIATKSNMPFVIVYFDKVSIA